MLSDELVQSITDDIAHELELSERGRASVEEIVSRALAEAAQAPAVPVMVDAVSIGKIDLSHNDPIALHPSLTYGFLRKFDGMGIASC